MASVKARLRIPCRLRLCPDDPAAEGAGEQAGRKSRLASIPAVSRRSIRRPNRNVGTNELSANADSPTPMMPQLWKIARPHVS